MPDWTLYDPQLQQLTAEGVSPTAMAKRLGLPRMTVVDRLRKLGLKPPAPSPPPKGFLTQEPPMPEAIVEERSIAAEQMSTIVELSQVLTPVEVQTLADYAEQMSTIVELSQALTPVEVQTLADYEAIIDRGRRTFLEVGQALLAIRDQRLYRQTHATFEDYCRERWDFKQSRAYQLMDAAEVVGVLQSSTTVELLPVNESQARPLATVPVEQQAEVWQEAVKTAPAGKVTAKHVQQTVKGMKARTSGQKSSKPKAPVPEPHVAPRKQVQDGLFGVLTMVRDEDAWTILSELARALDTYADAHEDPNVMQRMEQALSPLWHLIDAHTAE